MATPTFTLPTSGSDPRTATKEGLEENINSIIQYLDDARIVGDDRGTEGFYNAGSWDASTGAFPTVRGQGGLVQNGDTFFVPDGGAGVVDGQPQFEVGQRIIALVDNPSSTTYAGNWERANTIAILEPLTARVDAMSIPFDTVADFFAAELAEIKAAANAETGTIYAYVKSIKWSYQIDLSQPATGHDWTTTAGIKVGISPDGSGYRHARAFGLPADGTDQTALAVSMVATGFDIDWGGKLHTYGITSPLVMSEGQKFKSRGATIKALAVMDNCITRATDTEVVGLWIDCNNTQPLSGVPITHSGSSVGMKFTEVSDTVTERVRILRYRNGVLVTSDTAGVECHNHTFSSCQFFAGFTWSSGRSSNLQLGAYVGSGASPTIANIADYADSGLDREDVHTVTFKDCSFNEGQYGLALHRSSNISVVGGSFRRMSRAISMQHQTRGVTITGGVFREMDSTCVHMAQGTSQVSVVANRFYGTMANDNVSVQGYYGVSNITVANNVFDSQFENWKGGNAGDTRRPFAAMRFGQQSEKITVTGNTIQGYQIGVLLKTTIYETGITPSDVNYYNTGVRDVVVRDNHITGAYFGPADAFKTEFLKNSTYGVLVQISGAWEDVAQGAWDVEGITVEGNNCKNTAFSYVVEQASMSGGATPPVYKDFAVKLKDNKSYDAISDVVRNTVSNPLSVVYEGNTWPDEQDWTPSLAGSSTPGSQTYVTQEGKWTAKGRMVSVQGRLRLSGKDGASSGSAQITGLPIAAKDGAFQSAGSVSLWSNWTLSSTYSALGVQAEGGQSFLRLLKSGSGLAASYPNVSEMGVAAEINFSCEYEAA